MKMHLVTAVLLFCLLTLTNSGAAQQTKVAIGYSGISADQLVVWVACDAGIFAKNQLDAQAVYFSGGTISVTAMIAGDTPLIQASGPGIVSAGLAGAEPVFVVGGITTLDYWLMTQPEIKTAEQLKGGTVARASSKNLTRAATPTACTGEKDNGVSMPEMFDARAMRGRTYGSAPARVFRLRRGNDIVEAKNISPLRSINPSAEYRPWTTGVSIRRAAQCLARLQFHGAPAGSSFLSARS
jgi:hypothetical protein